MFLRLDLNSVGFTLGAFLIAPVPFGAYPAFVNVKIKHERLVFTLALLALSCLSYRHVPGRTYEHSGIFVVIKPIFFFSCSIADCRVESGN